MATTVTGTITRLVDADDDASSPRIFFMPDMHVDLTSVGTRHRLGSGEMWVAASLEGRRVGGQISCTFVGEGDEPELFVREPMMTTIRRALRGGGFLP